MVPQGSGQRRRSHPACATPVRGPETLAPEFTKADISPVFKANGTLDPGTADYNAAAANGFRDWRIEVGGLVDQPLKLSLADLRAMPSRTQITRHDCVEGWSCIGEWTGAPLMLVLAKAAPKANARYVVFYCADPMSNDPNDPQFYYESLDLIEACHPQTHACLRHERRAPRGAAWRARAPALRAPAWLQARRNMSSASNWSKASPALRAAMAAIGKTTATPGGRGFEIPADHTNGLSC